MQKKHRMKYLTMLLVSCLSTILLSPSLSAQWLQKRDLVPAAQVSPEDVTAQMVDPETSRAEATPRTLFPETLFDAGAVAAGTEITHPFRVKNTGKGDLVIERVEPG